ncbi:MAG: redox-regulated ATPase YchF [Acidobacteria bacterium]|nr:redox-regulated ATPase YchF [Acidobacteriota bacterium]MCL5287765.1 redox-regulated ATPase YchF [Acidobacteriota bacterium]
MKTGIIGLPLVGKTSLFKILTRVHLDAKAAHGATHIGVATVPDKRLDQLVPLYKPKKVTHASVEYVDVGGLVKDRAKDSAFLTELRQVDCLAHVVRLFDDPVHPHPAGSLNAARDADSVDVELMLNDLDQLTRRLERLEKDLKKKREPQLEREEAALLKCKAALEAETPLRQVDFTPEENKILTGFMFLSRKPMLYVINLGDDEVSEIENVVQKHNLAALAAKPQTKVVPFCGKIEAELSELSDEELAEMMSGYGLTEPGRDRVLRATYELLGLISFFTAGEPEVRAWTIERGTNAQRAAGAIHTDLERGFIKAEVVFWDRLLEAGSLARAKENGHVRLEGKEYIVKDGDVILFRHSG